MQKTIHGYRVIKELGEGCEGTVYLASKATGYAWFILKVFKEQGCHAMNQIHTAGSHSKDVGPSGEHLARYSEKHSERIAGMYPIEVVRGSAGDVVGLAYPYERLYHVPLGVFRRYPKFHQALFNTFCRSQALLLEEYGLGISDSAASNFMISAKGEFRFVDYGVMLIPTNDFRATEEGYLAKSLIDTLLIPIGRQTEHLDAVPLDQPYRQSGDRGLEEASVYSPWIAKILEDIRDADASVFLEPENYLKWGNWVSVDSVGTATMISKIILREQYAAACKRIRNLVKG